jgi:phosphatidate cytidylyltransferase
VFSLLAAFAAYFVAVYMIDQAENRGAPPGLIFFLPVILAAILLLFVGRGHIKDRIWYAAGPLYASGTLIPPVVLRLHPSDGGVAIMWLFLCVWVSDVGAFFVGRKFGGPKLWPRVSPKKTWSGFIGGLVTGSLGAIGAVLYARTIWGDVWLGGTTLVIVSIIAVLAAVAGDLFESAVKRRFDVKDSGSILPGHGGVMDRLDSFIFASIFTFGVVWVRGLL